MTTSGTPLVIAHRACPRSAPENSLAGIEHARAVGADVVEIDVRRSRDGVPMLLHDRWLVRTRLFPARLEWLPARHAARLGLRGRHPLPTLVDALERTSPEIAFALDVKDPGAGPAVVDAIERYGGNRRIMVWSKYDEPLRAAARLDAVGTALLRDTHDDRADEQLLVDAARLGARAVSAHWSRVTDRFAQRCAATGIELYAWCRRPHAAAAELSLLDAIVTDWPENAVRDVATLRAGR